MILVMIMINYNLDLYNKYFNFINIYYLKQVCKFTNNYYKNDIYGKKIFWYKFFKENKDKYLSFIFHINKPINLLNQNSYLKNRYLILKINSFLQIILPNNYIHYKSNIINNIVVNKLKKTKINEEYKFKYKNLYIIKNSIMYRFGSNIDLNKISKIIINYFKNNINTSSYENIKVCNIYNIPVIYKYLIKDNLYLKSLIN